VKIDVKKLKELKVGILYLLGSEARGNTTSLSDVDIGIVFTDALILNNSLEIYDKFYHFFVKIYPSKKEVDIVFLQNSPISLQFEAVVEGKVLYEVSSNFRADYTEEVLREYLDFEPLLRELDKTTLEAFSEENSFK